jgi:hypothetical protein
VTRRRYYSLLRQGTPVKSVFYHIKKEKFEMKINEDWLATIIGLGLLVLAMIGLINPAWVAF